jgi:hypothetical protein
MPFRAQRELRATADHVGALARAGAVGSARPPRASRRLREHADVLSAAADRRLLRLRPRRAPSAASIAYPPSLAAGRRASSRPGDGTAGGDRDAFLARCERVRATMLEVSERLWRADDLDLFCPAHLPRPLPALLLAPSSGATRA